MSGENRDAAIEPMLQRIYGEFIEMPGLRLTCEQAQRLWGLDESTCRELLDHLVDTGFLRRGSHGMYARTTDGRADYPRPRMAKADRPQGVKQAM